MTFKELFQTGQCSISTISAWVELWQSGGCTGPLQALLGLTDQEYQVWLARGEAGLAQLLNTGHVSEYTAVYLGWDELKVQLQDIVDAELGPGFTVDLERQDYYYWTMLLKTEKEMDEELSERICERLDLRDVDVQMFLDQDCVDNNYLCNLLSKLTCREVNSSHADENGVWIICKSLVWSSPEFTDQLLARCEKRLRKEIKSKQYALVDTSTACHQLFGFMGALKVLGLLDAEKWYVRSDHFADCQPKA